MYNKNVRYENDYYLVERNPMTIVIGVDCGNSLVLASDSKASSKTDSTKIMNAPKLFYEEPIPGYLSFILGGAGNPEFIDQARDGIFENCCRKLKELKDFKEICEKVVQKIRGKYVNGRIENMGLKLENKEICTICDNFELSLIVGVLVNGKIGLFTVSSNGYARPVYTYTPIGTSIGKGLTQFLFKKINDINMSFGDSLNFNLAINSILYIIEEVKEYDDFCGGKIQLKILSKNKKWNDRETQAIVDFFNENIYPNINEGYKLKEKLEEKKIDYARDDYFKDLEKASQPVKRDDKQKPSSDET